MTAQIIQFPYIRKVPDEEVKRNQQFLRDMERVGRKLNWRARTERLKAAMREAGLL